jgi:phospholipid/cholesterol/gamma-HCH transport system ATP-binding protein
LTNVCLKYNEFVVLENISLTAAPGQVVAIIGGSGSGKTTLLRTATGLLKPYKGVAHVFGHNINLTHAPQLEALRKRMGVLFQQSALFTDLNVFENVAFPLREHTHYHEPEILKRVLEKLNAVGLRAAAHLKVAELSGGMARRVALARAVILEPKLVFYDEPFAGLDPISLGITARLIRNLSDRLGGASVLISHDVSESFAIADHIYLVGQGRLMAAGTPKELSASHDPYIQQFLRGEPDGPIAFDYPKTPAFKLWLAQHERHR